MISEHSGVWACLIESDDYNETLSLALKVVSQNENYCPQTGNITHSVLPLIEVDIF